MVEPVTIWKTITTGRSVWLMAKPVSRVKKALNKRRARLGKPLLEINERRDEGMLKEILGSIARTAGPAATAYLAGQGIEIGDGTSPLVSLGLAVVVFGAMQVWSIIRKLQNKPRDV